LRPRYDIAPTIMIDVVRLNADRQPDGGIDAIAGAADQKHDESKDLMGQALHNNGAICRR
jgi:hypothetical protein